MMVGYARVSTDDQATDLQIDALERAGCDVIFQDSGVSGSTTSRPELAEAISSVENGDTLVVWKLDRLGRSLSHLITLTAGLEQRGVAFQSLSEAIDTRTASGRLLFHVMGALAEFERDLISERTIAGIAAARARGQAIGRPAKLSADQIEAACVEIRGGVRPLIDLAELLNVSPVTLRRALARREGSCRGSNSLR